MDLVPLVLQPASVWAPELSEERLFKQILCDQV